MEQLDYSQFESRVFKRGTRSRNKIAGSPHAYDVLKMLVGGQTHASVMKFLEGHGMTVSSPVISNFIRQYVRPLSAEDRQVIINDIRHIHGVLPPAATDGIDLSMDQVLRETLQGVARRIAGLENFSNSTTTLNSELEKLLVSYYTLRVSLRKQLQDEWKDSEIGAARKQAIKDIGKLAFEFIPADRQEEFMDKLEEYENGDLAKGRDAIKQEAFG